jgi:anthranilate synthase component 2
MWGFSRLPHPDPPPSTLPPPSPFLVQYLGSLGATVVVHPNDAITVDEILALDPAGVLVSPGPGAPRESGISLDVVARCGPLLPTLGVCMGHQCIGEAYGGSVVRAPGGVVHGKAHPVHHANVGVLAGLPSPFQAARYHSLVIDKDTCPDCLEVTAWTEDGTIMAVRHKEFPTLQGVQFHPESVITEGGMGIMRNWVESL